MAYAYLVTEGTYTSADGTRYRKGDTVESPTKISQHNMLSVTSGDGVISESALRTGPQPEVSTAVANKGKAEPVVIKQAAEPKQDKGHKTEKPTGETPVPVMSLK
jgi:hypothetical protein